MIFLDGSLGQFIDPNGVVWASSFVRFHWLGDRRLDFLTPLGSIVLTTDSYTN